MELNRPSRLGRRKSPSSDRFLATYHLASSPSDHPSSSSSAVDELNEDDVFFSNDFSPDPNDGNPIHQNRHYHLTTAPASSSASGFGFQHHQKPVSQSQNFGILAALRDPSRPQSNFYQKTSLSTSISSASSGSSPSSSRMIPSIPKPPLERLLLSSSSSLGRHHQSAPVNVPLMVKAVRKHGEFDDDYDEKDDYDKKDDYDEKDDEEGEMLPPHEIVARSMAQSPMLSCSVLEGVGRTLKGRDLRQVRNAIWRQTGFLD
ncbi:hypothetical protein SLA2020_223120 [Shorea laevis]